MSSDVSRHTLLASGASVSLDELTSVTNASDTIGQERKRRRKRMQSNRQTVAASTAALILSDARLYAVAETCTLLGCKSTFLYKELSRGRLTAVKLGGYATRIKGSEIRRYIDSLERFESRDAAALQRMTSHTAE